MAKSTVSMLSTKVEISMKKAEPGTWADLNFPRSTIEQENESQDEKTDQDLNDRVDAVDLSDL